MNSIWNFFTSVKLAITTLCLLAFTSIFGTIIPQGKQFEWYIEYFTHASFFGKEVGPSMGYKLALISNILDIPNMYYSWWFLALLAILSINLIVCSLDRFPSVWKQIKADNLTFSENRLNKMKLQSVFEAGSSTMPATVDSVQSSLLKLGWKSTKRQKENHALLFTQKGAYSRTGVYIVHASILIIFLGAFVGYLFGFKASVMIPETKQTPSVYSQADSSKIDLGFTVRCDSFYMEYYENGMPKEYASTLTIIENGAEVLQTTIEVNHPLTYNGITFYQASYEPYQDFVVAITDNASGKKMNELTPFQNQQRWDEENISYGVINAESFENRLGKVKLWITDGNQEPLTTWMKPGSPTQVKIGEKTYTVTVKQMFATGLQVAKDPGVFLVYLGFFLMLFGLYLAFFSSHRRIWLTIEKVDSKNVVTLFGTTNKNQIGFTQTFDILSKKLKDSINN